VCWRVVTIMTALTPPRTHFFLTRPAPPLTYTLSLHDALPISVRRDARMQGRLLPHSRAARARHGARPRGEGKVSRRLSLQGVPRSEEHTSELQSLRQLVCRLLLEKKKNTTSRTSTTRSCKRTP